MSGGRLDLSPEVVAAVDRSSLLSDVLDQHRQVGDALRRVESAGVPEVDAARGLVVCGMGGSAIGADLARDILGSRATRPLRTVRGYTPPTDVGPDTLVLAASYSGNTEETLSAFEAAGAAGAPRVALATHGRLAELAREAGVPVIGVPSGMQPRAAVVYMTIAALECAAACGAAPSLRTEIEAAAPLLERLAEGPDAPDDSHPKRLARALHGRLPVIFGADATTAVASRWKTQVNENAKRPAYAAVLPEADHNEICAWDDGADRAAVFLEEPDQHPRVRERMELTAEVVGRGGATVERVHAVGDTPFERVMALVLLGDLTSIYLAVLDGTDPSPVDTLDGFKKRLGQPGRGS